MSSDSSSVYGDRSSSRLPTSAPSSPPPANDQSDFKMEDDELDQIEAEEEKARKDNDKAEEKRKNALKRKKKKAETAEERAAKAKQLDDLLAKSAAFSDILTNTTTVLGRVGSGFDDKKLGEHDIKMAKQPKIVVGGTMRDYQLEGLTWMYELCSQGMSGILADEMGLGKTVQTISLIAKLREEKYLGPHLIIAPLSTLSNWIEEFHRWTPSIPVVMYHGLPEDRRNIHSTKIMRHIHKGRPTDKFPVVCTSYEMVLKDRALLSKINWEFIIIDEGHRMKNFNSKLFRELKTFTSATRLLITGTPLQNNLRELWSLLNFLLPEIFEDWETFESWFDFSDLQDEKGTEEFISDAANQELVKKMHIVLQPLLLRRIKADVAHYLPKKREYVLYAPMTKEQTDLYNVINDKNVDTRAFLENKVVERLTSAASSRSSSRKATPLTSRASSLNPKLKASDNDEKVPKAARSSPRGKKIDTSSPAPAPAKNAFAMMMGRGKPTPAADAPVATPAKQASKRKSAPAAETPAPKSAKSSQKSTPASSRASARGGRGKKAQAYREADSDDDLLSDDEFEAKLADEYAEESDLDNEKSMSADEIERTQTLELAKMEIGKKKLGNPLLQLRLVCNSPHNFYNPWATDNGIPVDDSIVTASGKMLLLDRLLPALFKKGHKVLIFSQFKTQLDILEDYCSELRKWPVCRIDGGVSQVERKEQIHEFNKNPKMKLFLLSTRAGGQGINLASADTVILFDSDWNPQQDLQAQDRAHRIGQTRPVIVYRLATKGTVEEELLMSADAKRRLEKLVIKKGGFRTMGQKIDMRETLDRDTLQALLLKDGEVYNVSGDKEILSDADLAILNDRSDKAYARAAAGQGDADAFKVVETRADGIRATGVSA